MSYIQIELGPLKKDEQGNEIPGSNKYGLKFNNYGLEIMATKMGSSAIAFSYAMIYGGLRGNSYAKEQEPEYSFEQVIDWIDNTPKSERVAMIEQVTKVMTETQNYKELIESGSEVIENESQEEKKSESEESALKT